LRLDFSPFSSYPWSVDGELLIQGHLVTPVEIEHVQQLLASLADGGRTRLSQKLCRRWDGRTANRPDASYGCRSLPPQLDQRGLIELRRLQLTPVGSCTPPGRSQR